MRTQFFLDIIKGIRGYKFENTTDLSVDRRLPQIDGEDVDESDEKGQTALSARTAKSELKAWVSRMALSGEQVLSTDIYQQAVQQGYYISRISWSCQDAKDSQQHIDCEAGFTDPVAADDFTFDVHRRWRDDRDAPVHGHTMHMTDDEKRSLTGLLEATAFKSFERIIEIHGAANGGSTLAVKVKPS